ncbi:MAG: D-alanyl-lipoteichoic acid biosynthesis protein DltB [Verrucomicrobia bacterium]|nr:D-alanyl-lipoteichoic acid biosynthesis protein DltB [Verrucomicrobiota bacterium]
MIPFANFAFFGILLYAVIPTVLLGIAGRANRRWAFFITLIYVIGQFCGERLHVSLHGSVPALIIVGVYAAYEWALATLLLRARLRSKSGGQFYTALLLALAPLAATKVLPLVANGNAFGFLGISYVTFRVLDILFCIRDGLITSLTPSAFFTYLFFFPTLSAGPIDRYRRFDKDWKRARTREEFLVDLDAAIARLFRGFVYKFILAALIKHFWVDRVTGGSFGHIVAYMYGYSLYLFFDFAGYSAFAIAFSRLLGIHTPENFDRPFLARNIRDFWNRWHMSLSFWFRDHVYMRFLLAATKRKWFKSQHAASYIGFFLSFGLMGLWHGTEPHYLIYGAYHACLLTAYDLFSRWNKRRQWWGTGRLWRLASIVLTGNSTCFGFLIFSGRLGR